IMEHNMNNTLWLFILSILTLKLCAQQEVIYVQRYVLQGARPIYLLNKDLLLSNHQEDTALQIMYKKQDDSDKRCDQMSSAATNRLLIGEILIHPYQHGYFLHGLYTNKSADEIEQTLIPLARSFCQN